MREDSEKSAVLMALSMIAENKASCVVVKRNEITETINARGIAPILKLYENGTLKDAFIVDKIIGKAAAMLMTLGEIKGCYGVTMSQSAIDWLTKKGIPFEYRFCTDKIINRTGDDICPMEKTVQSLNDEKDALEAVKKKIAELSHKSFDR